MSSIRTGIELQDNFTPVLDGIMSSVSEAVSDMEQMNQTMSAGIDTSAIVSAASDIDEATASARELTEALQNINAPVINMDQPVTPQVMDAPVQREVPFQLLANPPPAETVPVTPIVTEDPVIEVPEPVEVPVIPVQDEIVVETPEPIELPVMPSVDNVPQLDVPEEITVPITPVVDGQPDIEVPNELTVPVMAEVTEQPEIDVPEPISVPVTPLVTDQPEITVPDELTVPVTPIVTEDPVIEVPDSVTVPVTPEITEIPEMDIPEPDLSGVEQYQNIINLAGAALQQIVSIQERINSQSAAMDVLPDDVQSKIAETNAGIRQMQSALDYMRENPFNLDAEAVKLQFDSLNASINQTLQTQRELDTRLQGMTSSDVDVNVHPNVPEPLVDPNQPPVTVPVEWQGDFEVFTSTGVERFNAEIQSATASLNALNQTQQKIEHTASGLDILPDGATQDITSIGQRLQWITHRIQQIQNNKLNIGTDEANAGLEQLRLQLDQAVQAQAELNAAIDSADASRINEAYLRLSQTVRTTETFIRDEVSEQGRFNRAIQEGVGSASDLKSMIGAALAGYTGIAGVRKAFSFIQDATELFNTQLNAENQLMTVLGNMLDADYVAQFELEIVADTTEAVSEINAIQNSVDDVVVPVSAQTKAIMAEFDAITAKASEIQGKGIYGDEAMIAAGAEFATYFSDVEAITTMMDTLSNYAMGMSGGGAIDNTAMVDYATNLGKIMTGAYDAMTKKGFEFNDAQKAVIEGTATQEQLIAVLGDDYASLSDEMRAAEVISQIINESWGNLYETMSNTPEGQIIQMTNAWGDMKEVIGRELYPYVLLFVHAITDNWGTIEALVQSFAGGLEMAMGVLSALLEGAISFAQAIMDNWSWISPIIYGMAAALMVYYGSQLAANTISVISTGVHIAMAAAQMVHAAATGTLTTATAAEIAAQNGLNAALYACPIVWIIVLIIALIALFYAAVSAVNHFAGTSVSATGIICGAFMTALAFIGNIFIALWNLVVDVFVLIYNLIAEVANFIGNVFTDPIGAVCRLFFGLADTVLGILQALASAIDAVFGSNLAGSVQGWRDSISGWVDETFGAENEIIAKMNTDDLKLDRFEYGAAWDAGYSFGEGIDESIANFDPSNLFNTVDLPTADDYAAGIGDALAGSGVADDINSTAGNTGAMADALDISAENLKYLRDIAEQESINRYTTAEIHIEQTNNNTISSDMDLDGVVDGLTSAVNEAVDEITEGVHD